MSNYITGFDGSNRAGKTKQVSAKMSDDINTSMQRERLAGAAAKSHKLGPTPGGLTNESRTNLHEQLRNTPAQQATKSEQPTSDTPRTDAFWKRFWKRWPVNEAGECAAIPSSSVRVAIDQELKQLERELAAAKAENAELRKRPTMEEFSAWLMQMDYGDFPTAFTTVRKTLINPANGLAAFIEQRRKKV